MRKPLFSTILPLLVVLSGCSDDDNKVTEPDATTGTVMIQIAHVVGKEALEFDDIRYTNAAGNTYGVETLNYYLSDIFLMGPDGRQDLDIVHYVDGRRHDTHTIIFENVEARHYDTLGVTFGLDDKDNASGALPATSENLNMEWPTTWGGGYHYMKLEGRFISADNSEKGFVTHTGRYNNEAENRLNEHHFVDFGLELHQNVVVGEMLDVTLEMDINQFYEGEHQIDLESHSTGIMANKERQDEIEANAIDLFTLEAGEHDHEGDGRSGQ